MRIVPSPPNAGEPVSREPGELCRVGVRGEGEVGQLHAAREGLLLVDRFPDRVRLYEGALAGRVR